MYDNLMIDIETLGTQPDAVILQIGWCRFGPGGVMEERHSASNGLIDVAVKRQLEMGRTVDAGTLQWWMQQVAEGTPCPIGGGLDIDYALSDFGRFAKSQGTFFKNVWANSPSFDCVLLDHAFRQNRMEFPFSFRTWLDFRTAMKAMRFDPKTLPRVGTHHNALDDAIWQARAVVASGWFIKVEDR